MDLKEDGRTAGRKKLALYHPWIYLKGGAERTILELVSRSRHDWTVFTNHFDRKGTFPEFDNVKVVELRKISVKRRYWEVLKGIKQIIFQKLPLNGYDALMVSCEGVGDFVNFRRYSIPVVCFCHTPIKIIHDAFTKQRYLDTHNAATRIKYFIASTLFKLIDRMLWKKYCVVICNSEEVKGRVIRAGLSNEDRISIANPGVDVSKYVPAWKYEKYFLCPGRIMWTKNLELAVEAFKRFENISKVSSGFELVISGMLDEKSKIYLDKLKMISEGRANIKFVLSPSQETLFQLYQNCYSVLFPSLNEDWGIVPLEAMSFGKPVISVNRGGPTEVIKDGIDGFLAAPDTEAFADKMKLLAENSGLVEELGRNARHNVARYDWSYFVDAIDGYFDSLDKSISAHKSKPV